MQSQTRLHPSPVRSSFMIDKATTERLLQHCVRKTFPAKQNIFAPGDSADTLYFVVSGSLAIISEESVRKPKSKRKTGGNISGNSENNHENIDVSKQDMSETSAPCFSGVPGLDQDNDELGDDETISEQELVLGYVNAGEFVGELGLFISTTTERHVNFRTRAPSEIAEINYEKLLHLMKDGDLAQDCPKILYTIGAHLSKRLFSVSRKASSLAFVDVTERIFRAVWELAQHPEALTHPQGMQIKASRQELAKLSGCSREMAGRALKKLEKDGKLTARGKTIVLFCER